MWGSAGLGCVSAEAVVGSPEGVSPPGSHRAERDSLPSLRSCHSESPETRCPCPVGEEPGVPVIGIPLELDIPEVAGKPEVERVVHEQIRQHGRDRGALRGPPVPLQQGAVGQLKRRLQPPLDIQNHPDGIGVRLHGLDDEVPSDAVEELLNLAPEGESTSPTTSDSRPCTGCPEDLIRSQRWTARPLLVRLDSSLPPGTPPRLPISRSQTTSLATSTGPSTPPGERPVGQTPTVTSNPAPSLHPHYRGFSTTMSRSADMPRVVTQHLTVIAAWSAPSRTRTGMQCRGMSSHVPYKSSRSGSRHLHAGHRLANRREPARLIQELRRCAGLSNSRSAPPAWKGLTDGHSVPPLITVHQRHRTLTLTLVKDT